MSPRLLHYCDCLWNGIYYLCLVVVVVVFASFCLSLIAYAGPFQDAQNSGAAGMGTVTGTAQAGAVNAGTVPGYTTSNPPQTSMSGNAAALSNAGSTATATDTTGIGTFVQQSAVSRPQFNITAQDPLATGAQNIQSNAAAIAGLNSTSTAGTCSNVTTTTPDIFGTFTCSGGQTQSVYSSHLCTTGRTPDVLQNYTCTVTRPVTPTTCDQALNVTAATSPWCGVGVPEGARITNYVGMGYWANLPIGIEVTPICGGVDSYTTMQLHSWYTYGSYNFCDASGGLKNITLPTGWVPYQKLTTMPVNFFYTCYQSMDVYYSASGCNTSHQCSATFEFREYYPTDYGRTRQYSANTITVYYTQNYGVVTFSDQWVNQTCQ